MIAIIDYRAGNLTSVERALKKLGYACKVTNDTKEISRAERIIFPGVGAAGKAMEDLHELGLASQIKEAFREGKPLLGICLGTQIIFEYSEEDHTNCLGILKGKVRRFPSGLGMKIPHMGWNKVKYLMEHPVFSGLNMDAQFYFVHSYYPEPEMTEHIIGTTEYGLEFASIIAHNNLVAVQFHPEKSGEPGLSILKNFCEWSGHA
jgi:glutamine amidotransferase